MLAMLSPRCSYFWRLRETTGVEVLQYQTDREGGKGRERSSEAFLIQVQDEENAIHSQGTLHFGEHLLQRQVVQRGNRDDAIKVLRRKLPDQCISHLKLTIRVLL